MFVYLLYKKSYVIVNIHMGLLDTRSLRVLIGACIPFCNDLGLQGVSLI